MPDKDCHAAKLPHKLLNSLGNVLLYVQMPLLYVCRVYLALALTLKGLILPRS